MHEIFLTINTKVTFLFIGDSKGPKYFNTNKFHTKVANGEFFQTMVYDIHKGLPPASKSEEVVSLVSCIVDTAPLIFMLIFIVIDPEKLPFQPKLDAALNIY